ncbi:glycosyltransferase [Pajaroellobacter abortibovis]|nr:glycosyltransferase [Pajaroellobacter abortibovis]
MSLRVVHVVGAGTVGGAERMLLDLMTHSNSKEIQHTLVLFSSHPALNAFFRQAENNIYEGRILKESPIHFLQRAWGKEDMAFLVDVCRREKAQILHLHTFGSHVLGARAARHLGLKMIRTDHSMRVYQDLSCWVFSRWALAYCHALVSVSHAVQQKTLERASWLRIPMHVIHNGINTDHFFSVPLPDWTEASEESFSFVLVARLEPRKQIDRALRAIAGLPRARLHIVGDGPEKESLYRQATALGLQERVVFWGFQQDVRPAIAQAHVGLSSSSEEGLGLSLLEVMALGRPVVAPRVGGIPEIVEHEKTGYLADSSTVDHLQQMMKRMMAIPAQERARLGTAARKFVVEHASVEKMCAAYAQVYASLLSPTMDESR